MEKVTGTKWCVVHFFKEGFRRCEVMDGHLKVWIYFPQQFIGENWWEGECVNGVLGGGGF